MVCYTLGTVKKGATPMTNTKLKTAWAKFCEENPNEEDTDTFIRHFCATHTATYEEFYDLYEQVLEVFF
jgi:hypothetical protein